MRKYIISAIPVLLGVTLLFFNAINKNSTSYAETAFSDISKKFDKEFDEFSSKLKESALSVKLHFNDTLKIKDSMGTRNYLFDQLGANNSLKSIGFFQGRYKLIARIEAKSYIYAIDSTGMEAVKWTRFEGGKKISSWFESFDQTVTQSSWYKDVLRENNTLKLFEYKRVDFENEENEGNNYIFAGFSYLADNTVTVMVLEFSKEQLYLNLKNSGPGLNSRLKVVTNDDRELVLKGPVSESSADSIEEVSGIDSLEILITKHFENFRDVPKGTFNFKYKNQIYWNSFKRMPERSGIRYYLFTVPNRELITANNIFDPKIIQRIAVFLIVLGVMLLFIRNRFFYVPNKMKIDPVEDILRSDEDRHLEFKSSLRWDYKQQKVNPELEKVIVKTIAAFGNTDGGILLIGVDDDKKIIGLEPDFKSLKKPDADYFEVHLRNVLHRMMGVKYVSKYIRTRFEEVPGKGLVCKIKVMQAKEPLYIKFKNKNGLVEEKFYVRSGNSSHEITSLAEITDYINTKFN